MNKGEKQKELLVQFKSQISHLCVSTLHIYFCGSCYNDFIIDESIYSYHALSPYMEVYGVVTLNHLRLRSETEGNRRIAFNRIFLGVTVKGS